MIWEMTTWEAVVLNPSFDIIGYWADGFCFNACSGYRSYYEGKAMQTIQGEFVSWHMICWNAITQTSEVDYFLFPLALEEFALTFRKTTSLVGWGVGL